MGDSQVAFQLCSSRRNKQRTNIPLARFTPVSPYTNPITGQSTGLTQQALDMRRKAEILKYESNRMSTQTNNLTKNQRWSRLVNASGKSARLLDPTTVVCPGETAVRRPNPVPTTSSGIPGPVMYLYEDPDVPLYNYIVTRTYAFDVPNVSSYWDTTIYTNVGIYHRTPEKVFSLSIKQNINNDRVSYTLDIPIGIQIEGTHRTNLFGGNQLAVLIESATLDIYCNGVKLPALSQTKVMNITTIVTPTVNVAGASFLVTKHIGNLQFTNVVLETSPIYVFDFQITLTLTRILIESNTPPPDYLGLTPALYYFAFPFTDPTDTANIKSTLQGYAYGNMTTETLPERVEQCSIVVSPLIPSIVRPGITG
jgi:hypothetical protein